MQDTVIYTQRIEFGDCDPAGIVWFPNFFRWIDAASRHYFVSHGLPAWKELEASRGIIGTPLVDTQAQFKQSASYGDTLEIAVHIAEWRTKSFVLAYHLRRGETTIMECREVRVFAGRKADGSLFAHPIPADLRQLCTGDAG